MHDAVERCMETTVVQWMGIGCLPPNTISKLTCLDLHALISGILQDQTVHSKMASEITLVKIRMLLNQKSKMPACSTQKQLALHSR